MIVECPYLQYCFALYNFQAKSRKSIYPFSRILRHRVRALVSQVFAYKNYCIRKKYKQCYVDKVLQTEPGLHIVDFYQQNSHRNRQIYQEPLFFTNNAQLQNPGPPPKG